MLNTLVDKNWGRRVLLLLLTGLISVSTCVDSTFAEDESQEFSGGHR